MKRRLGWLVVVLVGISLVFLPVLGYTARGDDTAYQEGKGFWAEVWDAICHFWDTLVDTAVDLWDLIKSPSYWNLEAFIEDVKDLGKAWEGILDPLEDQIAGFIEEGIEEFLEDLGIKDADVDVSVDIDLDLDLDYQNFEIDEWGFDFDADIRF